MENELNPVCLPPKDERRKSICQKAKMFMGEGSWNNVRAYKSGYKKLTAVTRAFYSWKNQKMRLWPLFSPYDTRARNSIGIRGHNLSIYDFFGLILRDLTKPRHDFAIFY